MNVVQDRQLTKDDIDSMRFAGSTSLQASGNKEGRSCLETGLCVPCPFKKINNRSLQGHQRVSWLRRMPNSWFEFCCEVLIVDGFFSIKLLLQKKERDSQKSWTAKWAFSERPFLAWRGPLTLVVKFPSFMSRFPQWAVPPHASMVRFPLENSPLRKGGSFFTEHFCLQLSFFACSPLRCSLDALSHCK